jgi:hypothetical protein
VAPVRFTVGGGRARRSWHSPREFALIDPPEFAACRRRQLDTYGPRGHSAWRETGRSGRTGGPEFSEPGFSQLSKRGRAAVIPSLLTKDHGPILTSVVDSSRAARHLVDPLAVGRHAAVSKPQESGDDRRGGADDDGEHPRQ